MQQIVQQTTGIKPPSNLTKSGLSHVIARNPAVAGLGGVALLGSLGLTGVGVYKRRAITKKAYITYINYLIRSALADDTVDEGVRNTLQELSEALVITNLNQEQLLEWKVKVNALSCGQHCTQIKKYIHKLYGLMYQPKWHVVDGDRDGDGDVNDASVGLLNETSGGSLV